MIAELLNCYEKIEVKCGHFRRCGGCSFQDFAYCDQLKVKGEKLRELFFGSKIKSVDWDKMEMKIFGDDDYGYRTRMDYIVGKEGIGLRRKRRFDEIEFLDECWLIDNDIFQLCQKIYEEGVGQGLIPYDLLEHSGYWRYLSLRVNERGEVMLIFVTSDDQGQHEIFDGLWEEFSIFPLAGISWCRNFQFPNISGEESINNKVISIFHLINDGLADTNFGEVRKYWGEEKLFFEIAGLKIGIGPNTFFQNNIKLFNKLLERMLSWVNANDRVVDLYCGVGTLSLPLAQKVEKVWGVELNEGSVKMAEDNAKLNKIDKAEFVVRDLDKISDFQFLISKYKVENNYNVLVVDPPRKGLEKAVDWIKEENWEKIIYLSCNPLTLLKDLEVLAEKYVIKDISFWDLYPQTPHVETLVLLERNRIVGE